MMADLVRILNDEGIEKFQDYLAALRSGSKENPPHDLLSDAWTSAKLPIEIEIERIPFNTRLEAAKYLTATLEPLGSVKIEKNIYLWSWLALYYFDLLAPLKENGTRRPGVDYRFILSGDSRFYYRHLLFGTYLCYKVHGEKAPFLLYNPVSQTTKFHTEFFSRQEFITNKGIIRAANHLYFDAKKGKPKRGAAATKRQPGTLFRFIDVMHQLDLTYDLYSMTEDDILALLPPEFDEWKK
jgi:hypothetical protein